MHIWHKATYKVFAKSRVDHFPALDYDHDRFPPPLGHCTKVSRFSLSAKNEWTQSFITHKYRAIKKNESQEPGDIYLTPLLLFHVMLLIFERISSFLSSPQSVSFAYHNGNIFPKHAVTSTFHGSLPRHIRSQ